MRKKYRCPPSFFFFLNFHQTKTQTGCLDEPEPIDLSVLHLDSLTSRTAGMSRRKQSNPRQIKRKFFFVVFFFLMLSRRYTASPSLLEFAEYCNDSDHTEADSAALNYRHSCVACHGPYAPVSLRR